MQIYKFFLSIEIHANKDARIFRGTQFYKKLKPKNRMQAQINIQVMARKYSIQHLNYKISKK